MRTVYNEVTKQNEVHFSAELIAPLSSTEVKNVNGKLFKIASIKFTDKTGKEQKSTAMIYEGNYQHGLTVGQNYLAVASKGENGQAFIRLSHLTYVDSRATIDMFDFGAPEKAPAQTVRKVEEKLS